MGKRRIKTVKPTFNEALAMFKGDMERARLKGCTSKTIYYFEKDAEDQALFIRADSGEKVYPYKCAFCDYWHIGHNRDTD